MNWINNTVNNNQFWQVTFEELPTSLEMIRLLPEANLLEPYYAAALFIPALCLWTTKNKTALDIVNFLKGPKELTMREVQFIKERLRGKEYLPFSYFEGSTPENGYQPSLPYTITVSTVPTSFDEEGYAKLFLKSSGADSPRPIYLRQKPSTGEWFLWEQMILSDIRIPVSDDIWS